MRHVLVAASSVVVAQGASALMSFSVSSLAARALGVALFGTFTFLTANATMLSVLLDVRGLQWTNAIEVASGNSPGAALARSLRSLSLPLVVAAAALTVALASGRAGDLALMALLASPVLLLAQTQACFLGLQDFRSYNVTTIAKLAVTLGGAAAVFLVPSGSRLLAMTAIWGSASLLVAAAAGRKLARRAPATAVAHREPLDRGSRTRAWLVNGLSIAATRVELFAVQAALSKSALGIYAVVFVLADLMTRAGGSFGTAVLPWAVREEDAAHRGLGSAIVVLASVGILLVAGIGLLAVGWPVIFIFFGAAYRDAYSLAVLQIPGVVLLAAVTVINNVVAADGYPVGQIVAAGIGMVVKLAVLVLLLGSLGVKATAVALAIGSAAWLAALAALCPSARIIVQSIPQAARRILGAARSRGVQVLQRATGN